MKFPFVKLKAADFLALTLLHLKNVYFFGVFAKFWQEYVEQSF